MALTFFTWLATEKQAPEEKIFLNIGRQMIPNHSQIVGSIEIRRPIAVIFENQFHLIQVRGRPGIPFVLLLPNDSHVFLVCAFTVHQQYRATWSCLRECTRGTMYGSAGGRVGMPD